MPVRRRAGKKLLLKAAFLIKISHIRVSKVENEYKRQAPVSIKKVL